MKKEKTHHSYLLICYILFPYLHKYVRACLQALMARVVRQPHAKPPGLTCPNPLSSGPALAASLINLMDSELTWDEFIRWLHFTLLIFMLIGKTGRGQGQVEPARNPVRQNASSLISFLKIAVRFFFPDSARLLIYQPETVAGAQLPQTVTRKQKHLVVSH